MVTLVDTYFSGIIIAETVITILLIILRNKLYPLRYSLRFYVDMKLIVLAIISILFIAYTISIFWTCQRIEILSFLVLSILIAPVFEEIFFRGLLIGTLYLFLTKKKGFKEKKATLLLIVINPFIFSAWHILNTFTFQVEGFIARLTTGFIYAIFYWYGKRNLAPVIIAHSVYNLLVNFCFFNYL